MNIKQEMDRYEEQIKAHAIKHGYWDGESDPRCPYCGEEQVNDEGQFGAPEDYDQWIEHECASCGKTFQATWVATYSTRVLKEAP